MFSRTLKREIVYTNNNFSIFCSDVFLTSEEYNSVKNDWKYSQRFLIHFLFYLQRTILAMDIVFVNVYLSYSFNQRVKLFNYPLSFT